MKTLFALFFSLIAFQGITQTKGSIPTRYSQNAETEHFVLVWNEGQTNISEINEAKGFAEEVYLKLTNVLGATRMPSEKLIITFGGEGMDRARKKKKTPHVDFSGRIHLYRFDEGGYLSVLPHEMVHAVRINNGRRWDGFFEEGFASAIAYYLYPERAGFPRFGYDLNVIAGYWLTSGRGIPLDKMRKQHGRLNLKCQLQTYVTREDFFNYLAVNFGVEKLVSFAYDKNVGTDEGYQTTWGNSFSTLTRAWEMDLKTRFAKLNHSTELIEEYFKTTSVRYIPVCEAGTDY